MTRQKLRITVVTSDIEVVSKITLKNAEFFVTSSLILEESDLLILDADAIAAFRRMLNPIPSLHVANSEAPKLTRRQGEVLHLIRSGLTNKEIASQLTLSVRTIKAYISQLFTIFDVSNRTELVSSATDLGILPGRTQ